MIERQVPEEEEEEEGRKISVIDPIELIPCVFSRHFRLSDRFDTSRR